MEQYKARVAAVFGVLEPSLASKSPENPPTTQCDRKETSNSSSRESQRCRGPPPKRSRLEDVREQQRSGEHEEERGRYRRHGSHRVRPRPRQEPDYVRNPSKWTKYDLKEDGSQVLRGMSQDQVNKYAAFQFLDEIKKRKTLSGLQRADDADVTDLDGPITTPAKVVFKKPSKNASRLSRNDNTNHNHGNKAVAGVQAQGDLSGSVRMAEYVVGSKEAVQLHKERRQKRAKLISLHSEEEDSETVAGDVCGSSFKSDNDREEHPASASSIDSKEASATGQSRRKRGKETLRAISLSHLEEEQEEEDT